MEGKLPAGVTLAEHYKAFLLTRAQVARAGPACISRDWLTVARYGGDTGRVETASGIGHFT